jgi:hypothetical protein
MVGYSTRAAHARTNAWKICLDVEGTPGGWDGRSLQTYIILDMHQVPVLEEVAVALMGSGHHDKERLIRYPLS